MPGGDVNPYLAVAAMIAAGLHGIDHELPLEPPVTGNAYADTTARVPHTLRDALDLWEKSELARAVVRRGGGGALRQLRPGRAGRLRRRGDRLGAAALLRAPVIRAPVTICEGVAAHVSVHRAQSRHRGAGHHGDPGLGGAGRRGDRPRRGRPGRLARRRARGPRPAAPFFRRGRRRARRGAGRAGGGGLGPSGRAVPLGSRARPRRAAVLLGRAGTTVRPADPGARRAERHLPRAGRRGRPHRAVELPDADLVLGHGARAGRGVCRRGQARRGDPADRDADRRARAGGGPARGRVPGAGGQGQRGGAAAGRPSRWYARSSSPGRPRWASRSWPAARGR